MYTSDWLRDGDSAPDWLMRETSLNYSYKNYDDLFSNYKPSIFFLAQNHSKFSKISSKNMLLTVNCTSIVEYHHSNIKNHQN